MNSLLSHWAIGVTNAVPRLLQVSGVMGMANLGGSVVMVDSPDAVAMAGPPGLPNSGRLFVAVTVKDCPMGTDAITFGVK